MNVRAYRDTDLAAVVALFTAAVHRLGAAAYDIEQRAAWAPAHADLKAWRARLATQTTLVAHSGGTLTGFIAYTPDGHIDLLFVAPAHAGHGIATRLYQRAETDLVGRGVDTVFTEASLVARPFFARHGFEVVARQRVELRGSTLTRFAMRKTVRPAT